MYTVSLQCAILWYTKCKTHNVVCMLAIIHTHVVHGTRDLAQQSEYHRNELCQIVELLLVTMIFQMAILKSIQLFTSIKEKGY